MPPTNPDPIENAIQLLSVLVVPTADGSGSPTLQQPLYGIIQSLVGAIFNASTDMKTVATDITNALNEASTVMGKIGTALESSTGNLTNIAAAMTGLQNTLAMAQSLAPAGTAVVLNSASGLFQTIEGQLTTLAGQGGKTLANAGTELAQLAQLLTALAAIFP